MTLSSQFQGTQFLERIVIDMVAVIIFVKSSLSYTIIAAFNSVIIELLSFIINFCNNKFCVSVFYRPPSSDSSQLDQLFDTVESLNIVNFSNYILLGDLLLFL